MKLTKKLIKKINEMSYDAMKDMWRFDHVSIDLFHGESGEYFFGVMAKKKLNTNLKKGE